MLRKFFIILFLFIVGSLPVFAYSPTSGFADGECNYGLYGLRCGGIARCASDERCVWQETISLDDGTTVPNPYVKTNLDKVYVGKCVPSINYGYPCSDDKDTVFNVEEACGTVPEGVVLPGCPPGTKLKKLFSYAPGSEVYSGIRLTPPVECNALGSPVPCNTLPKYNTGTVTTVYQCIPYATCTVDTTGCNYIVAAELSGCASGETCHKTPIVDENGTTTGYFGVCASDSIGECTGLPGTSAVCATGSGCNTGEFCGSLSAWGTNDYCYDVNLSINNPATCISQNVGDKCGTLLPKDSSWPTVLTHKALYCAEGLACMTTSYHKDWDFSDGTYPDNGSCANCVKSPTDQCSPTIDSVTGLDSCCDASKRCGSNGLCQTIEPFEMCAAPNSSSPKPGSVCNYVGTVENVCDKCPVTVDGGSSYVEPTSGNSYCKNIAYAPAPFNTQVISNCSNACGCPAGNVCDNGACVDNSSCVQPNQTCILGGSVDCCSPDAEIPYSCVAGPYNGNPPTTGTCKSPICEQVKSTGVCTDDTEDCCPDDKPFCNDGVCGEAFQCTSEGECCPGFGEVCNADKQCEPAPAGECVGEDNVLPPAPGYIGPQIEIPQLFSVIGAILYPTGIGIGLFFIIRAGYVIMMSEGNPDEVKRGQEHLTSAVIGTLFIVLSTAILRVIINTLLG